MPQTEFYGSLVAAGVCCVAFALVVWQVLEHRRRTIEPGSLDERHFASQEIRRAIVAVVMLTAAAGLFVGVRIRPRVDGRANLVFFEVWLAVLALVVVLMALALVDWLATRRYAIRHRRAILREGVEILREELNRRASARREAPPGHRNGTIPHDPAPPAPPL